MDMTRVKKWIMIGEMAELNHVTTETLRYYDRIGLFQPARRDPENGYRYYAIEQCAQLDQILYLQALGMDLQTIRYVVQSPSEEGVAGFFQDELSSIELQISLLDCRKRSIQRYLKNQAFYCDAPADCTISLERLPERSIFVIDTNINFYEHDSIVYEWILRIVKRQVLRQNLPDVYFRNVSTIWRYEKVMCRDLNSHEFFVQIEPNCMFLNDISVGKLEKLPERDYLCIYCDHFDKEQKYAFLLLDEIDRRGLSITGDYICEVLADLPPTKDSERQMYFRIQIPVAY